MKVNLFTISMGGGGAERVLSDLLYYHPQNVQVSLSLSHRGEMLYNTSDIPVSVYDEDIRTNPISKLLYILFPKTLFTLYMHILHIKENTFDVSVSFLAHSNCINMLATYLLKTPTVISIRNNLSAENGSIYIPIIHSLLRILLYTCNPYVIVNSEENKLYLQKTYGLKENKTICIYNPKDIDKIITLSQSNLNEPFFHTDSLVLLTVGRLAPQKGHIHLLRIFSNLTKILPCKLVICGTGKLEKSLKKITEDLGVADRVLFTGWCDNPYKYMKRADIFVFPSLFEGQPNAMIEALICGCPIVSTDCDYGPREILANGKYGILTKKLDGKIDNPLTVPLTEAEQDMYDKVLYLMQHPEERERLRQLSSEQIYLFDKERCIKKYYDVFLAAAEERPLTDIE